jgi:hypothetical protein
MGSSHSEAVINLSSAAGSPHVVLKVVSDPSDVADVLHLATADGRDIQVEKPDDCDSTDDELRAAWRGAVQTGDYAGFLGQLLPGMCASSLEDAVRRSITCCVLWMPAWASDLRHQVVTLPTCRGQVGCLRIPAPMTLADSIVAKIAKLYADVVKAIQIGADIAEDLEMLAALVEVQFT